MDRRVKEHLVLKKHVKVILSKFFLSALIFLIGLILIKGNASLKDKIEDEIYNKSFKFTKFRNIYDKYFGKVLSLDKIVQEDVQVFNEKIKYSDSSNYNNGVKLIVSDNYLVPVIESGIVIYVGVKDNLNTVIVEQIDGIDVTYSNVELNDYKLYDYIEKGQILGEVKTNELYLSFEKDGEKLDYKEYI